jgi:GNAT superfamily N-acetyltransferase
MPESPRPGVRVRPFVRGDRDQLTALVNAHLSAVLPGSSVSVQGLLSSLEREPGEFLVDPWVVERRTLVAEQRSRVVAAAHLLRYGADADVGDSYRDTAEIRWLACWTAAPYWPDAPDAGWSVLQSCLAQIQAWGVRTSFADGSLPGPGVYGVPEQWPHIRALYEAAGYTGGRSEAVLLSTTARLLRELRPPALDLRLSRTLGVNGTRFAAYDNDAWTTGAGPTPIGYIEIDTNLGEAGRFSRGPGWADVGNLYVEPAHRRTGVATWLLAHAAHWLDLGGVGRLLTYVGEENGLAAGQGQGGDHGRGGAEHGEAAFWTAVGFDRVTLTRRMLQRSP